MIFRYHPSIQSFRRSMRKFALAFLALALLSSTAHAWNSTGHMAVAQIAYRELDEAQRKQLAAILKTHPHYQQMLVAGKPDAVDEAEWVFMRAAVWPDMVRPARPGDTFKSPAITRFHKGPWHYVDIPYLKGNYKIPPTTRAAAESNVLTAIRDNTKILSSTEAKMEDRAVAIAWLEHLIGDVHQPLHAATMYSEKYPDGDKGGNDQTIRSSSGVMRLHSYWDELLGTSNDYQAILFIAEEAIKAPNADTAARLKQTTAAEAWARESHDAAVALVYLGGELRSTPSKDWDDKKVTYEQVPQLPVSYEVNAAALARQRILLAGHRLAEQLKAALIRN
jgi:hypothetical protein